MQKLHTRVLAVVFILCFVSHAVTVTAQSAENGNYNDWNYSPTGVFGLVKLSNTSQRGYYKITRGEQSVKVQYYNASGKVTSTTVVRFVNGKISSMTRTNRWGDTYETTKYVPAGPDQFMVTRRNTGKNDFLPCKGAKYIFKNNMLAELRYIGYDNKPVTSSSGVAVIKYNRYTDKNRFSLLKEMSFYDGTGAPVISSSYDCHKVVYEYDERANEISEAYYGLDGEPLTSRFGGFKTKTTYDDQDREIRSEVIGLNEETTANSNGVAITTYKYTDGLLAQTTRYNDKEVVTKASATGDGVARIIYEYDNDGNEVKRYYNDEFNNPMNNNSGYHMVAYKYNPQAMLTEIRYFDKNKNPVNDVNGIHRYAYVKDAKNNTIQAAFYDKSNSPVMDAQDQVYMRKYRYDEFGRTVSTSYWKDESTPMPRWNGYYEQVVTYNADGQATEYIYLDQKGNLFTSTSGFSREVRAYNSLAQLAERKWFDGTKPALLTSAMAINFHSIKYYFDDKGRISSLVYMGTDGSPTTAKINIDGEEDLEPQKIEFFYEGNRVVEERMFKAGSSTPFKVINCIKSNYVTVSGITKGYKNSN